MLLSISLAAAMAAIAFGVVHVAGVTAEDRFTLVHLEFAAVVLVPAALLIAERWPLDRAVRRTTRARARRTADGGPGAVGRRSTAASAARGSPRGGQLVRVGVAGSGAPVPVRGAPVRGGRVLNSGCVRGGRVGCAGAGGGG